MTLRVRSRFVETVADQPTGDSALSRQLVSETIARWQDGERADATAFLAAHPEALRHKSVVIDLAYEEYCQRIEAGESIDREVFCARFPANRTSLYRLLEVHDFMAEKPDLFGADAAIAWPSLGETFLGFRLLNELGRGALARVYLACEIALGGRLVSIKVSRLGADEAELLGKLVHTNIVPVHSVRHDPDTKLTAICMPYLGRATLGDVLDGAFAEQPLSRRAEIILTLLDRLNKSRWPASMAQPPHRLLRKGTYVDGIIHLAVQLAEALAYTHRQGICHRDLKPSNVLLTPDGRPMLLDFNLSTDSKTKASRVGGTLPYMSPEQIQETVIASSADHPPVVDARSDLFSLGVILYELLSGTLPFGSGPAGCPFRETARQLWDSQQRGAKPLRLATHQADPRVAHVVERCLATDPAARFQSADELAASLRACLSLRQRSRRWANAHRLLVTLLGTMIVGGGITIAGYFALRPPFGVRQYEQGKVLFERGEIREALGCFQQSVDAEPKSAEALFALGRTWQQLGQYGNAIEAYGEAKRVSADPRIDACIGHCLSLRGDYRKAIAFYERAIAGGYATAAVYNNVGHAYRQLGKVQWSAARRNLDAALRIDPKLQAARYNRGLVGLNQVLQGNGRAWESTLLDLEEALHIGPESSGLHYKAALVAAAAQPQDQNSVLGVFKHLARAIDLGMDPRQVTSNAAFSQFEGDSRWNALLQRSPAPGNHPDDEPATLADPVEQNAFLTPALGR